MRVLCVSDIHGDIDAVEKLRIFAERKHVGHIFLLGDYSKGFQNSGENRLDIDKIMNILGDMITFMLPGNCDQIDSTLQFGRKDFHEKTRNAEDISFIGLGGSNPTPFGTPFELSEDYINEKLNSLSDGLDPENTILLTHVPPKDTKCDKVNESLHVGSSGLREFIEKFQPKANICGHIHEAGGKKDLIGKTEIFNIGSISKGNALAILDDEIKHVKFF